MVLLVARQMRQGEARLGFTRPWKLLEMSGATTTSLDQWDWCMVLQQRRRQPARCSSDWPTWSQRLPNPRVHEATRPASEARRRRHAGFLIALTLSVMIVPSRGLASACSKTTRCEQAATSPVADGGLARTPAKRNRAETRGSSRREGEASGAVDDGEVRVEHAQLEAHGCSRRCPREAADADERSPHAANSRVP